MMLPITLYGQAVLRQIAKDITPNYPDLNLLIENMVETMGESDGIGLAAPQIGLSIRLFVIDLDLLSDENPSYKGIQKAFINARIIEKSEETVTMNEACLSLPGICEKVARSKWVRLHYLDENFNEQEMVFSDYLARVVQHEYDHLDGLLFIDHISSLRKEMNKKRLNRILKRQL